MTRHRPIYENATDRANEAEVAALLGARFRCEARKQPKAYHLDYALVRGATVVAFAEVKDRPRYSWGYFARFGGYRLSLNKWMAARRYCLGMGLPFVLAVRAGGDARRMVCMAPESWRVDSVMWAGRKDRGDWQDEEPHVVFLADRFSPL